MKIALKILMGVLCSVLLASAAQADNQFAFDLYSHLSSNSGNVFFSPYSLSSALGMAYEGARNQTADQMQAVLHLSSVQSINQMDKSYELSTANALWAQKAFPFKMDYINLVRNTYLGEARNLDFVADPDGSRAVINGWVSQKTMCKINDLLPKGSISVSTKLVITNAVYFKGQWSIPFPKGFTKQDAFWTTPTTSVQSAMMELNGKSFRYTENGQAQVLELPYQGNDVSMLIILPLSNNIQLVEKAINGPILKQWDANLSMQDVNVNIPKFKFDADYQMKDILVDMGMKNAFDKETADLSGMASVPGLYIDQVYHKAWIDVDEEGTEAAAATGLVVHQSAIRKMSLPKIFRADHPFIFVIRENKTGYILFMGRVSDPRNVS